MGGEEEHTQPDDTAVIKPPEVSKQMSTLDVSADPFAPREGKTLTWRNVNMTLVRASLLALMPHMNNPLAHIA